METASALPLPLPHYLATHLRAGAAAALLLLILILLANLAGLRWFGAGYLLDIGARDDRSLVSGFFSPERDQFATTYRWSRESSSVTLRGAATGGPATLRLAFGGLPAAIVAPRIVDLNLNEQAWTTIPATAAPRHYALLLPPQALAGGQVQLGLRSLTSIVPPDRRAIGIRLDGLILEQGRATDWPLPPLATIVAQWATGLAWAAIGRVLGLGRQTSLALAALVSLSMAGLFVGFTPVAAPWITRLAGASLVILGLIRLLCPLVKRAWPTGHQTTRRAILGLTAAAMALRLATALYPTFQAHDLYIHSERLVQVSLGNPRLYDRPAEFGGQVTIVSPTFYAISAPLLLVMDQQAAIQGLCALLDGLAPLLLALLIGRLGGSQRTALLGATLFAAMPIQFTALYWGFAPQIVGQWLALLLALLVSGAPLTRAWNRAIALALCTVTLLIHNGVALLAGVWLGGFLVLALALQPPGRPWLVWLAILVSASLLALIAQYGELIMLRITAPGGTAGMITSDEEARLAMIGIGLRATFEPLPLLLVVAGCLSLFAATRGAGRLFVSAWLGSGLLFLAIDAIAGLQVRYGYFSLPIVCTGCAFLLDRLVTRRRGGIVAWTTLGLIGIAGLWLCISSTMAGVRPSLNPLTH